ncbi:MULTISPECIES: Scr1 family TA system antitoxin-like transcriptional regulator [unclassified Streptomyces]|uniref:helix-turn-helix domain-containing protein n=1 Tax=unclassified Streptomyces TaxID=2593676 RepID=UPI0035D9FAD6
MPAESEIDSSESLQHFIGAMIRRERKAKGWRQVDLATKAYSSDTRISEAETGMPPDLKLGRAIDDALDLDGALVDLLLILDRLGVRDYAADFLRDQERARAIHEYSLVVPGLLQTPDYARAIVEFADPTGQRDVEADVALRVQRQAVLTGPTPPWVWVLLDEAVLHRVTGSRRVMRDQLAHLLELSEQRFIHIQVVPLHCAAVPSSVSLLTAPDGARSAYTEGFITGRYMVEAADVDLFQRIYDQLHAEAEGVEASREIIRTAMRTHDERA